MATTITSVVEHGRHAARVSWSSDHTPADGTRPLFRVYVDGVLVDVTTMTSRDFVFYRGQFPVIEIRDEAEPGFTPANPARRRFVWQPAANTDHYRLEQFVGGAWALLRTVQHDGRLQYDPETDALADSTTHQFRVIPVGTNGNQGSPVTVDVSMIRHPDPPDWNRVYDPATQKITITIN